MLRQLRRTPGPPAWQWPCRVQWPCQRAVALPEWTAQRRRTLSWSFGEPSFGEPNSCGSTPGALARVTWVLFSVSALGPGTRSPSQGRQGTAAAGPADGYASVPDQLQWIQDTMQTLAGSTGAGTGTGTKTTLDGTNTTPDGSGTAANAPSSGNAPSGSPGTSTSSPSPSPATQSSPSPSGRNAQPTRDGVLPAPPQALAADWIQRESCRAGGWPGAAKPECSKPSALGPAHAADRTGEQLGRPGGGRVGPAPQRHPATCEPLLWARKLPPSLLNAA